MHGSHGLQERRATQKQYTVDQYHLHPRVATFLTAHHHIITLSNAQQWSRTTTFCPCTVNSNGHIYKYTTVGSFHRNPHRTYTKHYNLSLLELVHCNVAPQGPMLVTKRLPAHEQCASNVTRYGLENCKRGGNNHYTVYTIIYNV